MSASDKKKLRKEQNAAAVTEKQQTEKKQQKKLKAYTLTFIIAMVLIVAIVLVSSLQVPVKNLMMKSTTSVTVNDHEITAAEFNYFYMDAISNFRSQFSSYGEYSDIYMQMFTGFNPAASVGSQVYNKETGDTWADYFADSALASAKWTYGMYDKAMADNFELSEDDKKALENVESYMTLYATLYGYSDANSYVKAMYGSSASLETYMAYYELSTIASSYASKYIDGLKYTDKDYRDYEADKFNEFCSYTYATYTVNVKDYLTGGTPVKGEDNKITHTYSDAEKKAAQEAALADAKKLAESASKDVIGLNLAISKLEKAAKDAKATEVKAKLYSSLSSSNEDMRKWITSDERQAGDLNYFTNSTKTDDVETVNSYTVVLFLERIDNTMNIGTVRHLLVKFQGGTKDKVTGETVYSEAEKKAALDEAEKLLKEYKAGKQTEEAFTELLKKHSDDVDSNKKVNNDGLYSNITPDSGYVEAFTAWATAEHEKGDVEIIETEYGYHIMYYVEAAELNYRDTLIKNALTEKDYTAWEEAILDTVTTKEVNMKYLNKDLVLSASGK